MIFADIYSADWLGVQARKHWWFGCQEKIKNIVVRVEYRISELVFLMPYKKIKPRLQA